MLTACGGVATQPAATLRSTPPADLALSQATASAPTAEPIQSVVPSITPDASATLQPAPSPSTAPSTSPTPALADTPSPQPTPVLDPPPAAGPFSLRIPDEGAFVSQATAYWCVPAAMQTMINLIDDERPDRSRRTQAALYDLGRENSTDRLTGQGIEPEGWAEGLNLSGSGPYVVHIEPTRRRAIRAAAEAIRLTGRPVGLVVWRGAHSWVMSGFEATADPAYTKDYEVTGIYVQDVWYPRVSSIWGVSPEPGSLVPVERLSEDYLRFRRPTMRYPDRDGQFVLILPTLAAAIAGS